MSPSWPGGADRQARAPGRGRRAPSGAASAWRGLVCSGIQPAPRSGGSPLLATELARGGAQALELVRAHAPVRALGQVAERERAEGHPAQCPDRVADGGAHPPHLALAALVERELELVLAGQVDGGRRGPPVVELDTVAERAQRALADRPAADARAVALRDLEARVREAVRELAVVGEQDQAGRVGVESSDRVQPAG